MKKLVVALLVLFVVIGCVGLYRGWFTVDQARIQQDEEAAKAKVQDLGKKIKENVKVEK